MFAQCVLMQSQHVSLIRQEHRRRWPPPSQPFAQPPHSAHPLSCRSWSGRPQTPRVSGRTSDRHQRSAEATCPCPICHPGSQRRNDRLPEPPQRPPLSRHVFIPERQRGSGIRDSRGGSGEATCNREQCGGHSRERGARKNRAALREHRRVCCERHPKICV